MPSHFDPVQLLRREENSLAACPELPVEVWAIVCSHLRASADLVRLAATCWTLRPHALSKVEHHSFYDRDHVLLVTPITSRCGPPSASWANSRRSGLFPPLLFKSEMCYPEEWPDVSLTCGVSCAGSGRLGAAVVAADDSVVCTSAPYRNHHGAQQGRAAQPSTPSTTTPARSANTKERLEKANSPTELGTGGRENEHGKRRLRRMVEAVRFLAGHCPRLCSMDLSHATATTTATDHHHLKDGELQQLPIIELLTSLPSTLRSLNLSHTSIPPRGTTSPQPSSNELDFDPRP
jgi:hypothetical protein